VKIITIIGARPQFIKAATVSRVITKRNEITSSESSKIKEIITYTGQHYDKNMSEAFFSDLKLPKSHIHLCIDSGTHAGQTGQVRRWI